MMIDKKGILLRKKLLGAMLRQARVAAGKSLREVAEQVGTTESTLSSYENGRKAASLPEIELFAYHLNIPLEPFLNPSPEAAEDKLEVDSQLFRSLRDRSIGASLQKHRKQAGLTMRQVSERTELSTKSISAYEQGRRSIPLPDLERLATLFGKSLDYFLEKDGPIGEWLNTRHALDHVSEFPAELRVFLTQPENQSYILLAKQLSQLSPERLRAVAEGLLEIAR